RHFIQEFSRKFQKLFVDLSPEAAERLKIYGWPGNVRELRNLIERVVLLEEGTHIERDRKSTRLNSSHRTRSYAVFCLKKKSQRDPAPARRRARAQPRRRPPRRRAPVAGLHLAARLRALLDAGDERELVRPPKRPGTADTGLLSQSWSRSHAVRRGLAPQPAQGPSIRLDSFGSAVVLNAQLQAILSLEDYAAETSIFFFSCFAAPRDLRSFPTRRSSD